jgi:hypothetical protein
MESAGFGLPPGYERISADFLATTGRTHTLVDADHAGTHGFIEMSVDGKPLGGFEFWWSDEAGTDVARNETGEPQGPAGKRLTSAFAVVGDGIDPSTSRFSGARSTN